VIRVAKVRKPADFDANVKAPGDQWLKTNPGAKRPKALWEPYTATLSKAYGDRCGYAAMLDPTGGSVDHYLSFKNHRSLAYEWSNYRFASNTLNSSKRNADATVLDPHEVKPGWFKILLPSLQMVVTGAVPKSHMAKAEFTLKRLKLRDGERIIRWRKSWYQMYLAGNLTLEGLRDVAPLIAEAVDAQGAAASKAN
jgi:hypothetical protein